MTANLPHNSKSHLVYRRQKRWPKGLLWQVARRWAATSLPLIAFLTLLGWPRFRPLMAQQEPSNSVQEEDTNGSRMDDAIALFTRLHQQFDARVRTFFIDRNTGASMVLYWGNADGTYEWRGNPVRVQADRILILGIAQIGDSTESDATEKDTENEGGESGAESGNGSDAEEEPPIHSVTFYAEGAVRLEGAELVLEADAFFYDHEHQRGVAVEARGQGRLAAVERLKRLFNAANFRVLGEAAGSPPHGPTMGDFESLEEADWTAVETPDTQAIPPAEGPAVTRAEPLRRGVSRAGVQMAFRAELLRMTDFYHYVGEGLVIATCEYAVPHFGLRSTSMKITAVPSEPPGQTPPTGDQEPGSEAVTDQKKKSESKPSPDAARQEEGRPARTHHFIADPENTWIQFHGLSLLPFPLGYWDSRWVEYNPIREISYSHSGKYGNRVDVSWNLNWMLRQLPGSDVGWVDSFLDDSRLDLNTDYLSKRGTGFGTRGTYGREPRRWQPWARSQDSWDYHGTGLYYRIDDRGVDRSGPENAPPIDDERWWANVLHRQRIAQVGVLDVEYSEQADENFLNEYFPNTRTEKEQESLFYLRRNVGDNVALTGLYKYRTNDFETTRERIPEAKLFVLQQPVVGGLYTSLAVQGANLRYRPGDSVAESPRRYGRLDAVNEWSLPFGFGRYLQMRPFAAGRFTAYETGQDPSDHSISRESLAAGVSASQEWSRVFRVDRNAWPRRWFGITALKHTMVPKVTYGNLFENTVDPERLFGFDDVDTLKRSEAVEFSLRNILWARSRQRLPRPQKVPLGDAPGREDGLTTISKGTRAILDADARVRWFPQPSRDNNGDRFSFVDLDVVLYPSRHLSIRSRNLFDPNDDLDFELTDNSVTIEPLPQFLHLTAGERFRSGISEFVYGRLGINFSRKYLLEAYVGYDLKETDRTDVEVRLIRFLHRIAAEVTYSFDAGEGDNQTVSFNLYPVEMLTNIWDQPLSNY